MKKTIKKPKMKMIKELQGDNNRVFDLHFSSKQDVKIDMLVEMLPKTFKRSETGSGYCLMSNERDYSFRVRGMKRVNTLIAYFVSQMPRVNWKCYEKNEATKFLNKRNYK